MGGSSSKPTPVAPEPTSTTTTVPSTIHSTAHTPADDLRAVEVRCWINTHEILFMSLAFLSGVLLTVLVFALISLFRKIYKRPHQNLQEEDFSQMAAEDCARSPQNEVTYSTLVFQRGRTPLAV
ncbi:transmembrane protein C1orf162 homolog [Cyanocitta cristata]